MCICGGMEILVLAAVSAVCGKCGIKKDERLITLGLSSNECPQSSSKVPKEETVSAPSLPSPPSPSVPCNHKYTRTFETNSCGKKQERCTCGQWLGRFLCDHCLLPEEVCGDCQNDPDLCSVPGTDCDYCEWDGVSMAGRKLREGEKGHEAPLPIELGEKVPAQGLSDGSGKAPCLHEKVGRRLDKFGRRLDKYKKYDSFCLACGQWLAGWWQPTHNESIPIECQKGCESCDFREEDCWK